MKNGLEVFDFKEEEEIAEHAAGTILSKFKNPNFENPSILKCDLIDNAAQASEVVKKETCSVSREDFVAIEPVGMVREDSANGEVNMECCEPESCFVEKEARVSTHKSVSPNNIQSNCFVADSPSNSEPGDENLDDDRITNKSSPSSPASDTADDATENDHSTNTYSSASEMDVDIAVDYVLYRDNYCTGCLITFSSSGVKVSSMPAYEDERTFLFERVIDDIIRIESQQLGRFGVVAVKLHVLSKDVAQAGDAYGVEQLEFAVGEPNWSHKLEEIASLNANYSALSDIVRDSDVPMAGGPELHRHRPYFPVFDEAVEDVIYPKGDSDAVSISKRDFDLLQPETFVNDNIIDFYIKYLKNQIPAEEKHRFHFFNSFFFRKLADLDKDPSSASDGKAAFLRVRKWTRKLDIFGKDYVFIPVNFNLHWSLLVICHPGEVVVFKDENLGNSLKVPCILHMDSLKGTHAGLKGLVQSYLYEEWKSRHEETLEDFSSKFSNLRFVPLELPQQENSFDCGLFLLHYLELFLAEAPSNFSPFEINDFSNFLNVDWFPPAEASLKRTLIQRLICGLFDSRSHDPSSGDCSDDPDSGFVENNGKESVAQLVSQRCSRAVACHGNLSCSDASQGIEITLLESSSMRNSDCVSDSGLVLREFFEPGVSPGSLFAQCLSFDQPSHCRLNGAMSEQIEQDCAETGEKFVFPPSDTIFQQISSMTPKAAPTLYSSRGFGANSSWQPGVSMQWEDDGSSPETSECASDDSGVDIIENCSIVQNLDTSHKVDQQRILSMENMEVPAGGVPCSSAAIESSEFDRMHSTTENFDVAPCEETSSKLHEDTNLVENGFSQHSGEAAIAGECDDVQTMVDNMTTAELDVKQIIEDNVMAEAGEKHKIESDEKLITDDNTMAELHEKQATGLDTKQTTVNDLTVESIYVRTTGCQMMAESDKKQMSDADAKTESDEEQAAKRLRVTPPDEVERDGSESLSKEQDLHL